MDYKKLEENRKQLLKKFIISLFIAGLIFLVIFIIIIVCIGFSLVNLTYSALPCGVLYFVFIISFFNYYTNKYSSIFLNNYLINELKVMFKDPKFEKNLGFSESYIASKKLIPQGDIIQSLNYIEASYNGKQFKGCDIISKREERNSKNEVYFVNVFCGQWLEFQISKEISDSIFIIEKSLFEGSNMNSNIGISTFNNVMFNNGIGNININFSHSIRKNKKNKKLNTLDEENQINVVRGEKVQMESEKFNKHFAVYANNPEHAFYIITPPLMEKIEKINETIRGKFYIAIILNKIYIAIDSGHTSFNPNLFKKINENVIDNYFASLKEICYLLDIINI